MAELNEYKCPCCGGAIEFNSGLQKLKCPYCDTEFELDILNEYDEALSNDGEDEIDWNTEAGTEWGDGETGNLVSFVCKSCGGEIVGDDVTGATSCPFCGNPVVRLGQFSGDLKPDLIIPFKVDKQAAIAALEQHYKGKRLLPKVFSDRNHISEVKGIYVPFWLFDANTTAAARYRATRIRTWSDPDFNYTETNFFAVLRSGRFGFRHVPVDGSEKMADDLMESIEPYDFSEAVDFRTAYLAGYLADKYDYNAEQSIERANTRVRSSSEAMLQQSVTGFSTVQKEASQIAVRNSSTKYALYPVWLLNTEWNGQTYTFAMNGQTGKFVGDLPVDKSVYKKWLFGLTGAIGAVLYLLLLILYSL